MYYHTVYFKSSQHAHLVFGGQSMSTVCIKMHQSHGQDEDLQEVQTSLKLISPENI